MELIVENNQEILNSSHLKIKYQLPFINAVVIELDNSQYKDFLDLPFVKPIYTSSEITAQMNHARAVIHGEVLPYTGKGITIASLDTGIAPIEDFTIPENRILAFTDFINHHTTPYDDNGHGTHTCGIALGNGYLSGGKYAGIAPQANLVAVKTLDHQGKGNASDVLAGMQWILDNKEKYNIKIANLSIGTENTDHNDPLVIAAEALWDNGITVVTAAGNNGPAPGSISSPGISKKIITVGSSDDHNQVTISGNHLQNFSGRGPTRECIIKPDVIAPGTNIMSCLSPQCKKGEIMGSKYISISGTSMSTPMVSGAIALLLEKYPSLQPNDIKLMLKKSCHTLNYPPNKQGWGLLDIENLLSQEAQYVR